MRGQPVEAPTALLHSHTSPCPQLRSHARSRVQETGLEQYALVQYAEALEVVPRTIAENSGLPATDAVAALHAAHAAGQAAAGLDVETGARGGACAQGLVAGGRRRRACSPRARKLAGVAGSRAHASLMAWAGCSRSGTRAAARRRHLALLQRPRLIPPAPVGPLPSCLAGQARDLGSDLGVYDLYR